MGPREGRGEVAIFDFVPLFGDPRECRGDVAIPPICGPPRRQGEVATSDFLSALGVGDPRECRGDIAIPPICGPPRRQGEVANSDFVPFVVRAISFTCFVQLVYGAPFKVGFLMSHDELLPKVVGPSRT